MLFLYFNILIRTVISDLSCIDYTLHFEKNEECIKKWITEIEDSNSQITNLEEAIQVGVYCYKKKKYETALQILEFPFRFVKKGTIPTSEKQHLLYYQGLAYYRLKDYNKAIEVFYDVIKSKRATLLSAKAYNGIGRSYRKLGDYNKAIANFEVSHSYLEKNGHLQDLLHSYGNTSQVYKLLDTKKASDKSYSYLLKIDSLAQFLNLSKRDRFLNKLAIGNYFNQHQTLNISKASAYYKQALELAKDTKDSANIAKVYGFYSNLYNTTNPVEGLRLNNLNRNWIQKGDSIALFANANRAAHHYRLLGDYTASIKQIELAWSYLFEKKLDISNFNKLKKVDEKNNRAKLGLASLAAEIHLDFYKKNGNRQYVKKAIEFFKLADTLFDLIRLESDEMQSKIFWRKQSSELYGKAIEASYLLGNVDQAFYFMEKNKAVLLIQSLQSQKLKETLPSKEVLKNELALRKKIYLLKNSSDPSHSVTTKVLSLQRDLKLFQDSLMTNFPNYKAQQLEAPIVSLTNQMKELSGKEVVVMYNIGSYDDYNRITAENCYDPVLPGNSYGMRRLYSAYGIIITKKERKIFQIANAELLRENIEELLKYLKKPFKNNKEQAVYEVLAYCVYKQLLPNREVEELITDKNVRIIPDNFLHYLPFEALITDVQNNQYWLQKHETTYAYSNTFLHNLKNQTISKEKGNKVHPNLKASETLRFVAFAPVTFSDSTLIPIPNSLEEVTKVTEILDGASYTYERASKQKIEEELKKSSLIHIASHAQAQDSLEPWIAFTNDRLMQKELSLLSTSANLVVLSGCETLLGKQETGEGVMSLARGFFHAGAKSVISSLWSVDDQSTTEIMQDFYLNLTNGKSKSDALYQAKSKYLSSHKSDKISPYYWASFILIGNDAPIIFDRTSSSTWWWIACAIIFLATILILCRKIFLR